MRRIFDQCPKSVEIKMALFKDALEEPNLNICYQKNTNAVDESLDFFASIQASPIQMYV